MVCKVALETFANKWQSRTRAPLMYPLTQDISTASFNLDSRARILNFKGVKESIPRNQFRQAVKPGGPVRQPYISSVPSPHRLFQNSRTGQIR
jgi:hypothetical protein